jgi:hypothetical protein
MRGSLQLLEATVNRELAAAIPDVPLDVSSEVSARIKHSRVASRLNMRII